MPPAKRSRIKAASWWNTANKSFENIIMESLRRAQQAELAEEGHECGHQFTIQITMRGHSSGAGDDPTHGDAQYADTLVPVVVRAHDLRSALLLAAAKPLGAWFPKEEEKA